MSAQTSTPAAGGRRASAPRARARHNAPASATPSTRAGGFPVWTVVWLALGAVLRGVYLSQLSKTAFGGYIFGDSAYYIEQSRLAWHDLIGAPAFLSPLYPALLKIFTALDISLPNGVRVTQMAAGVLCAWLLGRLAARWVTPAAGRVALAIAAVYPPLVFFEGEILPASLAVLFQVLALSWAWEARAAWRETPRPARLRALGAGLAAGVAALLAPPVILVGLALVAWWFLAEYRSGSRDLRGPASVLAGLLLALAPTTLGTLTHAHTAVPLSTSGGINLWIGNNPEATGTFHLPVADSLGGDTRALEATMTSRVHAASPAAASGVWTARALRAMAHDPLGTARLWGKKLLLLANHVEGPSQSDFGYIRSRCWALFVPIPFVAVFALGLAGLLFGTWRASARPLAVWAIAAAALSPVVVFVTARHRLPMLPLLIVGAAAAVVAVLEARRGGDAARRIAPLAVTAAVLAAIGFVPLGSATADRPRMLALEALGELGRGKTAQAVTLFEEARGLAPNDPAMLANLGAAYQRNGDLGKAVETLRHAATLAPGNPAIAMNLGRVYLRSSHPDSAATEFRRAAANGGGVEALRVLAATERQEKHWDAAAAALQQVIALDPSDQASHSDLGAVYLQAGRTQDAIAVLEAVTKAGVLFPDPWMNLAAAYRGVGRIDEAMRAMERAAILAPGDRGVMLSLATAHRALGNAPRAIEVLRRYLQHVGRDSLAQALLQRYRLGGV